MPARPPKTLYWRRRAVALVLLAAAVAVLAVGISIVLAGLGGGPLITTGSSGGPAMPAAAKIHVVEPGDTLWSIVRASGVRGDPRAVVDQLQQELGDRPLQIGQRVPVP